MSEKIIYISNFMEKFKRKKLIENSRIMNLFKVKFLSSTFYMYKKWSNILEIHDKMEV